MRSMAAWPRAGSLGMATLAHDWQERVMRRVLVVDDEPAVCLAVQSCLRGAGYFVLVANDVPAAIDALTGHHFDLALVDLCMRQRDGLELIRSMRQLVPHTRIILMSGLMSPFGSGDPDFLGMSLNLAGTPRLAKPFRGAELLALVAEVAGESRGTA